MHIRHLVLLVMCVLVSQVAQAQEVYVHAGYVANTKTHDTAYRWGTAYMHEVGKHALVSLTYLNEGHLPQHHRDGYAPQVWLRQYLLDRHLSFELGIGPYFYFDTDGTQAVDRDRHGWGGIASVAATWHTGSPFLFQIRGNWIDAVNSFNTLSVTGAIGYRLGGTGKAGHAATPENREAPGNHELSILVGEAKLNQSGTDITTAEALEYRYRLARHVEWSFGVLNEGPRNPHQRYGVDTQLWLVERFYGDRLALGAGLGPYLAYDRYRGSGSTTVNGLVGLSGNIRFWERFGLRFTWDRVLTNYDHDADIFIGGLSYSF